MNAGFKRWLATGLLLGSVGCSDNDPSQDTGDDPDTTMQPPKTDKPSAQQPPAQKPDTPANPLVNPDTPVSTVVPGSPTIPKAAVVASLTVAKDCDDLLTRVQDDAIAKLMMQVDLYKKHPPQVYPTPGRPIGPGIGISLDAGVAVSPPSAADSDDGDDRASTPSVPTNGGTATGGGKGSGGTGSGEAVSDPVSASDTNAQVEGVDEADFVKVVNKGKNIYLLHGDTLRKLASWPASQTALVGDPLQIEGSPSEMFVTDEGKAVIFSTVYGYPETSDGGGKKPVICYDDIGGGGYCGYGGSARLKITVADVTGKPTTEREIYYEGNYLSSRSYPAAGGGVVRTVIQSYSKYAGLFAPQIEYTDAFGRAYDQADIDQQLDDWERRTEASIRKTKLDDWFPIGQETKDGKLVDIQPACGSYFIPDPGLTNYGLTQVISLDLSKKDSAIGGVTIVGNASTVYSNASALVLAQPDYRWGGQGDFGIINQQQTALHVFALSGASTKYTASGWLFGSLPSFNPQFGLDVAADGTLRMAATGWVRDVPTAEPSSEAFWKQHTENVVQTARINAGKVEPVGKSDKLGKEGESVQSARFLGDRAYVITYRQIDPLIALDVKDPASIKVLGELEIPGFAQYVHPLDETHLITFGQSANRGTQLQLFDVTDPKNIPAPRTLDFGQGSSSEVSYNHKAFTSFEGGLLALPLYGAYSSLSGRYSYASTLEVIKADAKAGLSKITSIDHAALYANNGLGVSCGVCDFNGCYDYACAYQPEVRRGHFVKGDDGKVYVYSFSYAGVLVTELGPPARQVAKLGLPQPVYDSKGPWYGAPPPPETTPSLPTGVDGGVATTRDASVRTP